MKNKSTHMRWAQPNVLVKIKTWFLKDTEVDKKDYVIALVLFMCLVFLFPLIVQNVLYG